MNIKIMKETEQHTGVKIRGGNRVGAKRMRSNIINPNIIYLWQINQKFKSESNLFIE